MSISPALPLNVWQMIHAMANGERLPLHIESRAMMAFDASLHEAQKPPEPAAEPAAEPEG